MSRAVRRRALALAGPALAVGLLAGPTTATAAEPGSTGPRPTIVLVHGAFADASGWSAEIRALTAAGYPVVAPADPLRGLASDARYVRGVLATIDGPVVLVGHSYGGAVIAAAARGASNVRALVYVSAFIPEHGNPTAHYIDPNVYPGSLLSPDTLLLRPTYNPVIDKADTDAYIAPASFRAVFAADRSTGEAAVLAAEQRPLALSAFLQRTGPAADLPSWDLVSLEDRAIPPAAQLAMAHAAGAHITTIHSAHDSLISHPDAVDRLIVDAARSTG